MLLIFKLSQCTVEPYFIHLYAVRHCRSLILSIYPRLDAQQLSIRSDIRKGVDAVGVREWRNSVINRSEISDMEMIGPVPKLTALL